MKTIKGELKTDIRDLKRSVEFWNEYEENSGFPFIWSYYLNNYT